MGFSVSVGALPEDGKERKISSTTINFGKRVAGRRLKYPTWAQHECTWSSWTNIYKLSPFSFPFNVRELREARWVLFDSFFSRVLQLLPMRITEGNLCCISKFMMMMMTMMTNIGRSDVNLSMLVLSCSRILLVQRGVYYVPWGEWALGYLPI